MDEMKDIKCQSPQWLVTSRSLFDQLYELNKQMVLYNDVKTRQEALKLYNNFTQSLLSLGHQENPWDKSMPLWGDFAEIMLSIVMNIVKKRPENLQDKWIKPLKDELLVFQKEKKTSYLWFFLYCDRLTYVIDKIHNKSTRSGFNPAFTKYKQTLLKGNNWKSHERYLKACEKTGDRQTYKMSSPLAQAKLFPHVVCLPYPGLLSDWDLVKYFPSLQRKVNLWLCGFSIEPVCAEGTTFTSSIFFAHDYRYLAIILSGFSTYQLRIKKNDLINQILSSLNYQIFYDLLIKGRDLFDRLLINTIEIIEKAIENDELSEEEEGVFKFFTFVWVHEGRYGLFSRIYQAFHNDGNWWMMGVNDQIYYKFLFPDSIQKLSDDERLLIIHILSIKYANLMNNTIHNKLKKEISFLLKEVESQAYASPFQYRFPEYISDETGNRSSKNFVQTIPDLRNKAPLKFDLSECDSVCVNVVFPTLGLNTEKFSKNNYWIDVYTST